MLDYQEEQKKDGSVGLTLYREANKSRNFLELRSVYP
jgi:hypothetical protein